MKNKTFLEKIGRFAIASPLILLLISLYVVFDSYIFQLIWNILAPKLFHFKELTIMQSLAVNIVVGYNRIRDYKIEGQKKMPDWENIITSRLFFLLVAYIVSLLI